MSIQNDNTRINPLTLSFPGDAELAFLSDYHQQSVTHVRVALLLGAFLYGIYGILDGHLDPGAKHVAWIIRYAIVCPAILLCFLMTFQVHSQRAIQRLEAIFVMMCGWGIIYMMKQSSVYATLYFPGILLVISYGFSFCKMRFVCSIFATAGILMGYIVYLLFNDVHSVTEMWNNIFHILVLVVIGIFSAYHMELYARRDYLQRQIIRDEQKKNEEIKFTREKDRIVKNLHDGIGGIITNINFLSEVAATYDDTGRKEKVLGSISELSSECLAEIRTFINVLEDRGQCWRILFADMHHFGRNMLENHGIALDFQSEGMLDMLISDNLTAINLMRIYREALANVIKHAKANTVSVLLTVSADQLEMVLRDDGHWQQKDDRYAGRGIANMQARAVDMGGRLELNIKDGTKINLFLPLGCS